MERVWWAQRPPERRRRLGELPWLRERTLREPMSTTRGGVGSLEEKPEAWAARER